jgi:hypothetical protein
MTEDFQYSFDELEIVEGDIAELLGFDSEKLPEPFPYLIAQGLLKAPDLCSIKGGYKIFETIQINLQNNTIQINNQTFSPSKIVVTQFKNATFLALFVCTAGEKISEYSKQVASEGDKLLSYIFDVIGSVTVEKATIKIQKSLELKMQENELCISDRFSPGYCEWSVAEQQQLFSLLPNNFCGVTLSHSFLMRPMKSVSGIIAIGKGLNQKGYQCHWCNDKSCMYGKIKRQKKI